MKTNSRQPIKGFTIVELVIVIVIIGLLTAIVSVSYGTYQKRSVGSVIKSDLVSAQGALKLSSINENNQAFGLPSDFRTSQDVSVNAYGVSLKQYCIEGSHSKYSDLTYYLLSSEKEPKSGTCVNNQPWPIAWWKLNGNGDDSSGYGRHVTAFNATPIEDKFYRPGMAYRFTGTPQYLYASTAPPPNTKLTLSAWVKPTSYPASRATIFSGGPYKLLLGQYKDLQAYWEGTSPAGYAATASNKVNENVWTFVTAAWDGEWVQLYINGQYSARAGRTGTGNVGTNTRIGMETLTSTQYLGGVDDVRVYGRTLSSSEILNLYNVGPE